MTGCALMILQMYKSMDFKAVTVAIEGQPMDVSEIPFPAVTIFNRLSWRYHYWFPEALRNDTKFLESTKFFDINGKIFLPNVSHFKPTQHPTSRHENGLPALVWKFHWIFYFSEWLPSKSQVIGTITKVSKRITTTLTTRSTSSKRFEDFPKSNGLNLKKEVLGTLSVHHLLRCWLVEAWFLLSISWISKTWWTRKGWRSLKKKIFCNANFLESTAIFVFSGMLL